MRAKQKLIVILLFFVTRISFAQDDFLQSKRAYLGQITPREEPVVFAKKMLLDSGIVLGKVQFSRDGRAFYYSFARHWFDRKGSGTKEIKFENGSWQKPTILVENLTNPALSPTEDTLYLGGSGSSVWVLRKTGNGLGVPQNWLQKQYGLYNFQQAANGTFYAGSNANAGSKSDYSTYDFCKLTINENDTTIASLGNIINTNAFDGDFYIAPDESYIIVSAKETKDFECELWISFRKHDETWTAPLSLGEKINTGLAHRFGQYVSPDGKYLFFTKGTSEKDCNIYWVKIDATIAKLRKQAGVE